MVEKSHLNARMAAVQPDPLEQFVGYGDGIFTPLSHLIGKHRGPNITPENRYENKIWTKIRISNEWAYGITADLYKIVKYHLGLKICRSEYVSRLYFVATLLRNAHLCLYDGLTARYFQCSAPELEDYFAQRQP
jgi:hypothetical protein